MLSSQYADTYHKQMIGVSFRNIELKWMTFDMKMICSMKEQPQKRGLCQKILKRLMYHIQHTQDDNVKNSFCFRSNFCHSIFIFLG